MSATATIPTATESAALELMEDFLNFGDTMTETARLVSKITSIPAERLLALTATTNG